MDAQERGQYVYWRWRKCPDFININGQKKIIELFGKYWHGPELTGQSNMVHEQERKDIFAKYGYRTLVVWELELKNESSLKQKLINFHSEGLR